MTSPPIQNPVATLLRPIRGTLIVAIICQVLASALVLSPLITGTIIAGQLLDDPTDPAIWSTLIIGTALLAAGLLLRGVADLIAHLGDNSLDPHDPQTASRPAAHGPAGVVLRHGGGVGEAGHAG